MVLQVDNYFNSPTQTIPARNNVYYHDDVQNRGMGYEASLILI